MELLSPTTTVTLSLLYIENISISKMYNKGKHQFQEERINIVHEEFAFRMAARLNVSQIQSSSNETSIDYGCSEMTFFNQIYES